MHSRGCCCSLFWLLIFSHLYTKYSVSGGSLIFVLLQTVNLNFKKKKIDMKSVIMTTFYCLPTILFSSFHPSLSKL